MANTTTEHPVDVSHIGPAVRAWRDGDPTLLGDLYEEFTPIMEKMARDSDLYDKDDAMSTMSEAFLHLPASFNPDNPGALGFIIRHLSNSLSYARADRLIKVPYVVVKTYKSLKARYTEQDDQADEWLTRAYTACNAGTSGQTNLTASGLLAAHHALYAETNTIPTHLTTDENGDDVAPYDAPAGDPAESFDTHDLVHNHLLPLLGEDERLVVLVTYGFSDLVPEALDKVLVEKGVDLTDGRNLPLSSRTAAEVLGANGYGLDKMGYMTVQRRLKSALAKMRAYLDEDSLRENA